MTTPASPKADRSALAPRWLAVLHRYVGLAMGLVMLMWFASGFVMLFVHWPEVTEQERVAALNRIDWRGCCDFGREIPEALPIAAASIEATAGRPVLRLTLPDGGQGAFDLASGRRLPLFGPEAAAVAASAYARGRLVDIAVVERDQWTVAGEVDEQRPFWRVRLADGRHVYVSAASGQVAQATTADERFWNWLGAIPHWLYPQALRRHAGLWAQVVIWAALAGTFLTLTGLWLGVAAWRHADRRPSPYRGLMAWHHLAGLAAGVLTLAWVASGLLSMQPWGLLRSGPDAAAERLQGAPPTWARVRPALAAAAARRPAVRQLRLAAFRGEVFVMADGARLDSGGRPAPLSAADLARAGASLGPVKAQGLITRGDAYHFGHHDPAPLPAWRVVRADGTRHYLDPASGALLRTVDGPARGFRWLHLAPHRLDVIPGAGGPGWALAVSLLLAAAAVGVATGVWLGWRRLKHDVAGIFRRRPG